MCRPKIKTKSMLYIILLLFRKIQHTTLQHRAQNYTVLYCTVLHYSGRSVVYQKCYLRTVNFCLALWREKYFSRVQQYALSQLTTVTTGLFCGVRGNLNFLFFFFFSALLNAVYATTVVQNGNSAPTVFNTLYSIIHFISCESNQKAQYSGRVVRKKRRGRISSTVLLLCSYCS